MSSFETFFVSGHLDLSQQEFDQFYTMQIEKAIAQNAHFVIGDAKGADAMAQKHLAKVHYRKVTIYHIGSKPRNLLGPFETRGWFKNDEERDKAMTNASQQDIAWVRSEEMCKKLYGSNYKPNKISGTAKNILRRTH
jgi:hypothetical protein